MTIRTFLNICHFLSIIIAKIICYKTKKFNTFAAVIIFIH